MFNLEEFINDNLKTPKEIKKFTTEHKLYGQVISNSPTLFDKLDENFQQLAQKESFKILHRNTVFKEELKSFDKTLNQFDIIILKGGSLITHLYLELQHRWMSDIDLLIKPQEIEQVSNLLQSSFGYQKIESKTWGANNFKIVLSKNIEGLEIVIELHSRLFFLKEIDYFNDSIYIPELKIKRLSLEKEFIHLVGHCIFQHNFLKFYWILDCVLFFEKYHNQMNVNQLFNLAKEQSLLQSLKIFFNVLQSHFHIYIDENYQNLFLRNKINLWKLFFHKSLLLKSDQKSLRYKMFKFMTKDSIFTSIWYAIFWVSHKLGNKD